jgi:hypothetical protein
MVKEHSRIPASSRASYVEHVSCLQFSFVPSPRATRHGFRNTSAPPPMHLDYQPPGKVQIHLPLSFFPLLTATDLFPSF